MIETDPLRREDGNVLYLDHFAQAKKTPYDLLSAHQKIRLVQLGIACQELTDVGGSKIQKQIDHWVGAQLVAKLFNEDGSAKNFANIKE